MPAPAPEELTEDRDKWLWREIASVYEDYCGHDSANYPSRTKSFVGVLDLVRALLIESPEFSQ